MLTSTGRAASARLDNDSMRLLAPRVCATAPANEPAYSTLALGRCRSLLHPESVLVMGQSSIHEPPCVAARPSATYSLTFSFHLLHQCAECSTERPARTGSGYLGHPQLPAIVASSCRGERADVSPLLQRMTALQGAVVAALVRSPLRPGESSPLACRSGLLQDPEGGS